MSDPSYIPPCPKCNVAPRVFGEALFACIECPKCGDFVMGVGIPDLHARWVQGERGEVFKENNRIQGDHENCLFWATIVIGIGMFIASISVRVDAPTANKHPTSKACPAPASRPTCSRFVCPRKESLK